MVKRITLRTIEDEVLRISRESFSVRPFIGIWVMFNFNDNEIQTYENMGNTI